MMSWFRIPPIFVLAISLMVAAGCATAAPIPHSLILEIASPSSVRQAETMLGFSVAMDEDWIVVGSPFDDIGGEDSGVVWIHDATSGTLVHRLDNPAPLAMSHFGWSVAVHGNRVVIGAPDDNTGASDAGIAFVYDLGSSTPTVPAVVLGNPNPAVNDGFGYSVAIAGTNVIVGAPDGDSGVSNAGCVYVFDLASPTPAIPARQLNNPDIDGQKFGHSVAISGTRYVIGASQDSGTGDLSRAYVYDLASGTPGTPVLTLQDGSPSSNEQFGFSVSISGDRVLVSAPRDDTWGGDAGLAYAYDLSSATPQVPTATLRDSTPAANDLFGMTVSLSGDLAVVGAHLDDDGASNSGSAYIFNLASATPEVAVRSIDNPGPATNDEFGRAVSLAGTRLLVGANGDNTGSSSAGTAYVFELVSPTPEVPVITLNNPSPSSGEEFGGSVAISGPRVVIGSSRDDKGATNAGSAALYDLDSVNPEVPLLLIDNPSPTINDYFGGVVAMSGPTIAVSAIQDDTGASNAGSVYIYNSNSSLPGVPVLTISNPSPQAQDEFGSSLSISGDLLVVGAAKDNSGAEDAGSVYVYNLASSTPAIPIHVIGDPDPAAGDGFGHSVAVSGNRLLVGAPRTDGGAPNAGSVYVFDLASTTPTVPWLVLGNPAPALNDEFGSAVAVSGPIVVVGSPLDDSPAMDSGDVKVYDLSSGTPAVPVAALTRPVPMEEDYFGASVSIAGTRIVVGAPGTDRNADEGGAAYVYEWSSVTRTTPADVLEIGTEEDADLIGSAVSVDGLRITVTAPGRDGSTHDRGAAYVFEPEPPTAKLQVEEPPGSVLLEDAANIHFETAEVGSTGTARTVLLRNVGTTILEIQDISLVGGNSGDFECVVPSLPVSLAVDQTMEFQVSFQPTTTGTLLTTLGIQSNAGTGGVTEISLTGQGLSAADDTDGDGLNDVVELRMESMGLDWQVNDEELVDLLRWGGDAAGLHTAEQLQEMNPSTPLIPRDPVSGGFKLTVVIGKSSDLSLFNPLPIEESETTINSEGGAEFRINSSDPKAFFRFEPR